MRERERGRELTRNHHAALAHHGLVAGRKRHDGVVDLCPFGDSKHLVLGRIDPAVPDVMLDGVVEQGRVLGNHSDGFAQRLQREVTDVLAVHEDPARLHVVEAEEQSKDGGFSVAHVC